jgi:flavin reductase (DIM6/NTAB) family NADH-FMN oxidoreductase RutF
MFRDCLGSFATGITVVTSRRLDGRPVGVTISSFTSVSLDPPLILFCLARGAESLAHIQSAGAFSVHVLAAEQQALSSRFASPETDRWDGFAVGGAATNGCPIIDGVLARLDCQVYARHDGGDHEIIVGAVTHLDLAAAGEPLLYLRGQYRHVAA